jgi:hypothetical protein
MGYTHYWKYNPNEIKSTTELRKKFLEASRLVRRGYQAIKNNPTYHEGSAGGHYNDSPCKIKGGLGEGNPIFNASEIWFNGDAEEGLDHETFSIKWNETENFSFCKTARKPYDVLVCYALLCLDHVFDDGKVFSYSSDGGNSDWKAAYLFAKEVGGFEPKKFEEELVA